jgi:hypothetical protein
VQSPFNHRRDCTSEGDAVVIVGVCNPNGGRGEAVLKQQEQEELDVAQTQVKVLEANKASRAASLRILGEAHWNKPVQFRGKKLAGRVLTKLQRLHDSKGPLYALTPKLLNENCQFKMDLLNDVENLTPTARTLRSLRTMMLTRHKRVLQEPEFDEEPFSWFVSSEHGAPHNLFLSSFVDQEEPLEEATKKDQTRDDQEYNLLPSIGDDARRYQEGDQGL